jgi:hypothetical protein
MGQKGKEVKGNGAKGKEVKDNGDKGMEIKGNGAKGKEVKGNGAKRKGSKRQWGKRKGSKRQWERGNQKWETRKKVKWEYEVEWGRVREARGKGQCKRKEETEIRTG